jgi:hypothetical protein
MVEMGLHSLLKHFCPAVTLPGASELRRGKKPLPSEQQTGPVLYPSILELGTHSGPQVPSVFVCLEELTPPCGLPHARPSQGPGRGNIPGNPPGTTARLHGPGAPRETQTQPWPFSGPARRPRGWRIRGGGQGRCWIGLGGG